MKINIEVLKKEYRARIISLELSIENRDLLIEQSSRASEILRYNNEITVFNEIIKTYKSVISDLNGLLLL